MPDTDPSMMRPSTSRAADRNPPSSELTPSTPTLPRRLYRGWGAFRTGAWLTVRYPQLLLLSWAVNLLSALLLAALPALSLAIGPGDRPVMRDLADGVDTWLWIESLMSPQAGMQRTGTSPGAELSIGLGTVLLWTLVAALVLPILAWLAGAFLQGGILLTYQGAPQPFRWHRFLWGCWHWWGAFLLLGALQGLAALLFLLPVVVGALLAFGVGNPALGWSLLALALAVDLLGLAVFEWSRVVAVTADTRDVFRSFGRAVRLLVRHPLPVMLLYLLTLAAAALLHGVYRLGLLPILPLDAWLLVLLVAQTFLAARIATRLIRLAGATALAGTFGNSASPPLDKRPIDMI